jgi:hypothetical protein
LDVCQDPAYGHKDLVAHLDSVVPDLTEALSADRLTTSRIRVTSLGPGDGTMDEHLLRGLDRDFQLDSYRGLDFSFDLLRRAAHRLEGAEGFRHAFPIQMVCGDFTGVQASLARNGDRVGRQLFSLTGFTMGNYREDELLQSIASLMMPADYLFLDARIHDSGRLEVEDFSTFRERAAVSGHYAIDSVRRFVFGPVEVATLASADDVEIDLDVSRSVTIVPGALNLVIHCSGLDTTMRLTGARVQRERLDLAVTTTYDLEELLRWFETTDLRVVWHETAGGTGFFLLTKT